MRAVLLIVMVISLCSCYTAKTFYRADREGTYWSAGKDYRVEVMSNVTVMCRYNNQFEFRQAFSMIIENTGQQPHLISPADCTITCGGELYSAADPEKLIKASEDALRSEQNDNPSGDGWKLLSISLELLSGKKRTPQEQMEYEKKQAEEEREYERRKLVHEQYVSELQKKQEFLTQFLLRKTTLHKGQKISGNILFDMDKNTDDILLSITVDENTAQFPFRAFTY